MGILSIGHICITTSLVLNTFLEPVDLITYSVGVGLCLSSYYLEYHQKRSVCIVALLELLNLKVYIILRDLVRFLESV